MQSFDRSIFHSTSNSLGFSLAAQRKIWLIHVCKVGESVTSLRVFVVFWFLRGSLLQDFFESSYWSWMLLICNLSFCFLSFFILFTASYIKYPCAILASLESTIFFIFIFNNNLKWRAPISFNMSRRLCDEISPWLCELYSFLLLLSIYEPCLYSILRVVILQLFTYVHSMVEVKALVCVLILFTNPCCYS